MENTNEVTDDLAVLLSAEPVVLADVLAEQQRAGCHGDEVGMPPPCFDSRHLTDLTDSSSQHSIAQAAALSSQPTIPTTTPRQPPSLGTQPSTMQQRRHPEHVQRRDGSANVHAHERLTTTPLSPIPEAAAMPLFAVAQRHWTKDLRKHEPSTTRQQLRRRPRAKRVSQPNPETTQQQRRAANGSQRVTWQARDQRRQHHSAPPPKLPETSPWVLIPQKRNRTQWPASTDDQPSEQPESVEPPARSSRSGVPAATERKNCQDGQVERGRRNRNGGIERRGTAGKSVQVSLPMNPTNKRSNDAAIAGGDTRRTELHLMGPFNTSGCEGDASLATTTQQAAQPDQQLSSLAQLGRQVRAHAANAREIQLQMAANVSSLASELMQNYTSLQQALLRHGGAQRVDVGLAIEEDGEATQQVSSSTPSFRSIANTRDQYIRFSSMTLGVCENSGRHHPLIETIRNEARCTDQLYSDLTHTTQCLPRT
jgi:hypothetical protein